jgi:hypothetical protein
LVKLKRLLFRQPFNRRIIVHQQMELFKPLDSKPDILKRTMEINKNGKLLKCDDKIFYSSTNVLKAS